MLGGGGGAWACFKGAGSWGVGMRAWGIRGLGLWRGWDGRPDVLTDGSKKKGNSFPDFLRLAPD